jgi:hypothetical protein
MNFFATVLTTSALFWGSMLLQDAPDIPNAVKHAFTRHFDVPSEVTWKKIRSGYEVDFNLADVAHSARYTADGELLMVKMVLDEQDLPPVIGQRIIEDYRQFAVEEIYQIKAPDRVLFQVALSGPSEDRKVVFTQKGEVDDTFPYWN